MNLEEAKECLSICKRTELRDHFFHDREVDWYFEGVHVASGYFSLKERNITIYKYVTDGTFERLAQFDNSEADQLVGLGESFELSRNDKVGPEKYYGG